MKVNYRKGSLPLVFESKLHSHTVGTLDHVTMMFLQLQIRKEIQDAELMPVGFHNPRPQLHVLSEPSEPLTNPYIIPTKYETSVVIIKAVGVCLSS